MLKRDSGAFRRRTVGAGRSCGQKRTVFTMDSTHKEHFMNRIGNRMMLWRYAVVCLLTWLYSGEKSISPMKL